MTKKIIKTIIITLICVASLFCFTLGALTIFAPYTMGKTAQKLGADRLASAYFEVDYKTHKSNSRLYNLTASTYYAKQYNKTIKYGEILLNREDFTAFIGFTEQGEERVVNENYLDACIFILSAQYLTLSTDFIDDLVNSVLVKDGEQFVDFNEYSKILYSIIHLVNDKDDKETLQDIKAILEVDVTAESFAENKVDVEDGITTDYEQYIIALYTLQQLIEA